LRGAAGDVAIHFCCEAIITCVDLRKLLRSCKMDHDVAPLLVMTAGGGYQLSSLLTSPPLRWWDARDRALDFFIPYIELRVFSLKQPLFLKVRGLPPYALPDHGEALGFLGDRQK